jgi:hypothetical protein
MHSIVLALDVIDCMPFTENLGRVSQPLILHLSIRKSTCFHED